MIEIVETIASVGFLVGLGILFWVANNTQDRWDRIREEDKKRQREHWKRLGI